ncbi:MAG: NAD-dependent epimerase/dehydratase family protein [Desulfotomaculum sp.]|nr:NAD-dependent epimerase/dehydratase family protein [Desulfotomaculum sp.]
MRILVTGGAGFIGSHIVDMLVEQDYRVLVVDNLSTGREDNLNPRAEFSSTDICSRELIGLVGKFRPEIVIHQAAQVSVPLSLKNPVDDAMINVLGTVNLLEACRLAGVRKIIYASSAAVYGNPVYLPVDEKHPVKPGSGYGLSKHTCERYLELYRRLYGLEYTVLRYANVYGPRQDGFGEGGVVAKFIECLRRGASPVIYGDGRQTRDFVYVKDAAGANLAALSAGDNRVLNVSTGNPTSINKLFSLLKDIAGFPGEAVVSPPRPGDITDSCLDSTLAAEKIKWKPRWTLKQGLMETYLYPVIF